jgi:hypothetical protein
MTHYTKNPIVRHGTLESHFTMLPNELVRDATLSHHAHRIAVVLRSHNTGYQVSAASLAKEYGWGRDTTAKALRELIEARWLVIRRYQNASGGRVFDEYHVDVSARFTEEESAALSCPVTLSSADDPTQDMHLLPSDAAGCLPSGHLRDPQQDIKEDQLEEHSEEHEEDSHSACWICDGSGVDLGRPCEACRLLSSSSGSSSHSPQNAFA